MNRPAPKFSTDAAVAREYARRRALEIVTRRHYFALRDAFLAALAKGAIGMGDLLLASDTDLLERAGVALDTLDEPARRLEA